MDRPNLLGSAELADADIADAVGKHVGCIDRGVGQFATDHLHIEHLLGAGTTDTEGDGSATLAAELFEHLLIGDADAGHVLTVDLDNAVAGAHADFLGRTSRDDLDDSDGVVVDHKLHTDAAERAVEFLVDRAEVGSRDVCRVRVEILEESRDAVLQKAVEIDFIHIIVADEIENSLEFFLGCRAGRVSSAEEVGCENTRDESQGYNKRHPSSSLFHLNKEIKKVRLKTIKQTERRSRL